MSLFLEGAGRRKLEWPVCGNNAYASLSPLKNVAGDARAVGAKLQTLGFSVETLTDVNFVDSKAALARFAELAADSDVALIFYSGHGLQVKYRSFLLPVDARMAAIGDLAEQAVALDVISAAIAQ